MCNSPHMGLLNPPPSPASSLAFTPAATLKKRASENEKIIGRLQGLLQAEKIELNRLLARQNSLIAKRARSGTSPLSASPVTSSQQPQITLPTTPDLALHPVNKTQDSSPRSILQSYHSPASSPQFSTLSTVTSPTNHTPPSPNHLQMAARGSHWSFVEKARFEAALHKYGPFAWDQIIRAVGSRTEKQVKAYAARYRRRKKLAARVDALMDQHMQLVPTEHAYPSVAHLTTEFPTTPTPPLEDSQVPTEPSLQSQSDPIGHTPQDSSADSPQDIFGQELTSSYVTDVDPPNSDDGTLLTSHLMDDPMLVSSTSAAITLPDGSCEVDVLLDQAIEGSVIVDDETKSELVQLSEDPLQADFLSSLFNP